jgi:hypothetical protein
MDGTEPGLNLVVELYRTGWRKLKDFKGFLKPNFELGPNPPVFPNLL